MKDKNNIAKSIVLSDFLTGLSIAWFSAGTITPVFSKVFNKNDIIQIILSILIAIICLIVAVKYKRETV